LVVRKWLAAFSFGSLEYSYWLMSGSSVLIRNHKVAEMDT